MLGRAEPEQTVVASPLGALETTKSIIDLH
jgi:hypothetical protein